MAGLPKKFAKMGFAKGWKEYKKTLKFKSSKVKNKKTKTPQVRTMAKKRKYRKAKTQATKSFGSTFLGKLTKKIIPVAYGFGRDKVSDWIAESKLGKKLPVFGMMDEVTMLGINFALTKFGARKNPIVRRALQAQEDIELASVGRELGDMFSKKKEAGTGGMFN